MKHHHRLFVTLDVQGKVRDIESLFQTTSIKPGSRTKVMDQIMIHNYGETLCFGSHEGATKWYNAEGSFLLLLDENEDPAAVRGSLQVVLEAKVHPKLLVVALAHPKWVEIGSFHVFTDWSKLIASRKEI